MAASARDRPEPGSAPLGAALRDLVDALAAAADRATFLEEALDLLLDRLGADRGLVLLGGAGEPPLALHARAPERALTPAERAEISRSLVEAALASGRPVVFEAHRAPAGESLAELGIRAALAAPLAAPSWRPGAGAAPGALYVDFRREVAPLGRDRLELFRTAAALLGLVFAEREERRRGAAELLLARAAAPAAEEAPHLDRLLAAPSLAPLRRELDAALAGDGTILLVGESGTGKTLLAEAIARALGARPVVRATLGASDDLNTIASELFGHERGAFSGAVARRTGLVEAADGGVLILDEILNLPLHAQQLLLDLTQFGTFRPLGWERPEPKRVRARIVAVTQGDLEAAVAAGRFRSDLYYRLAGCRLRLPPLRERRGEIVWLAESILRRLDPARAWRLAPAFRRALAAERCAWPGNLRQLESALRRARERALAGDPEASVLAVEHLRAEELGLPALDAAALPAEAPGAEAPLASRFVVEPQALGDGFRRLRRERAAFDAVERELIARALERHRGVVARAAAELGLSRTGLLSRMATLGIARP